jgi:hypothetical protein
MAHGAGLGEVVLAGAISSDFVRAHRLLKLARPERRILICITLDPHRPMIMKT